MNRAYKFRLYPNDRQKALFAKTFGLVRFLYNGMLGDRIDHYERPGEMLRKTPAGYKDEDEWLRAVDSLALCNAELNLNTAFRKFFKEKGVGFPKYKSKKNSRMTYTTNLVNGNIRLEGGYLVLPKVKAVKIKRHREIPEGYRLKSVTVSKTPSGKYFASIVFEYEQEIAPVEPKVFLGLDFSMKELFVSSDGNSAEYPRYYRQALDRLKREQRKLSLCQKGSNNRNKQRLKVARLHEKVVNQRKDFLHKRSRQIANAADAVCLEDLNMKAMGRALNFGKSVSDNAYSAFTGMLDYKLKEQGKYLVKVGRWFPSSKKCRGCGEIKSELALSKRVYCCEKCGLVIDRDYNASLNIREEGRRLLLA